MAGTGSWKKKRYGGRKADAMEMPEGMPKEKKPAKEAAMDYLRFRERSLFEVKKHLKEKEYSQEEIEEALDFLVDCNLASDERYCENYFQYALEKGKGPIRLRHELKEKGISEELIQAGLEEYLDRETQRENALEKAEKLLPEQPTEKDLARVARRLASLGYENGVIYDVLGRFRHGRGEDWE